MPLDSVVAAELLARLLSDDQFRTEFRRDPVATCRGLGLDDVADELGRESARAFQTLEVRESRSSLAGVLLAAAAEGVGVAELAQSMRAGGGGRWPAAAGLSPPEGAGPASPAPPGAAALSTPEGAGPASPRRPPARAAAQPPHQRWRRGRSPRARTGPTRPPPDP